MAVSVVKVVAAVVSSFICISTICCGRRHVNATKLKEILIPTGSCVLLHEIFCIVYMFGVNPGGYFNVCIGINLYFTIILWFITNFYPKIQRVTMFMVFNILGTFSILISCVLLCYGLAFGIGPESLNIILLISMCIQLISTLAYVVISCYPMPISTNASDTGPRLDSIQNVLPAPKVNDEGLKSRSEQGEDAGVGPAFSREAYENIY